ncbi:hypothetical protein ILYODFUR_002656 [Ilyodon furcidens]|uniref:Uncharacterized protein n=1 Tax=Ilyodon furcidens TaxID=33524 RepID=A0ABV0TU99_9TELE
MMKQKVEDQDKEKWVQGGGSRMSELRANALLLRAPPQTRKVKFEQEPSAPLMSHLRKERKKHREKWPASHHAAQLHSALTPQAGLNTHRAGEIAGTSLFSVG